jgi:hypothetical protein
LSAVKLEVAPQIAGEFRVITFTASRIVHTMAI